MKRHLKRNSLIAAMLSASLLAGSADNTCAGPADERAIEQVAARLTTTALTYAGRGWHLHDFEPDFIHEGTYGEYSVYIDGGSQIIFRGLGDHDARDIDLAVFSPNGRLVARDTDLDPTPFVTFVAPRSGVYTIRLSLPDCRANGSYCALLMAEQ